MKLSAVDKKLLEEVADLHTVPQGAYNIRKDGEGFSRHSTENIEIRPKEDKPGIDIIVKPGTKDESVHIPVLVTKGGFKDLVYNTFEIGEESDVLIVAGCGIHNASEEESRHEGIHNIFVRKGARLRYVEKHYGQGEGKGERVLNPQTIIEVEEGGTAELELVQIRGVDSTNRVSEANLHKNAKMIMTERLLTHGKQQARSDVIVNLRGPESFTQVTSRSVAQGESEQIFYPRVIAYEKARGYVECDSIIMDQARVRSVPEIAAYHPEAELTHEAAIGKIAGEQLLKLMTLGLAEDEAVEKILEGFLR
ncbi:MAG: SufD family Fe-S cluster assembly protein [Candidatus Syntrophonatronum acetioxidans]|uniref:SufD family Fe-S cluster assembly protein n=1 Tax=Candidatus Syntrophonatronum acetioxidans TaxID=1795816 RepID=A0A424YDE0_9FIRM|nr:MAG: SufD family Fe-S cluster assembly protein [Candidatus Syntrophonatronum acetioxidans]